LVEILLSFFVAFLFAFAKDIVAKAERKVELFFSFFDFLI
jgi:hypothetical protein